jgi:pimeloyl-ACP methyl ester carboxylesterase
MATVRDLGLLAAAAYDTAYKPNMGWTRKDIHASRGGLNGFQAAIFVKGNITVISFRGTAQAMDVVADAKLGTGMNSTYFSEAEAYVRAYRNKPNVYVCGHSLGGAIAQIVANRCGFRMVTFNAPGVAVLASRNIAQGTAPMNLVRAAGLVVSTVRHPMQAARDVASAFNVVRGLNVCLENDIVSQIGIHYGNVLRIPGTSANPLTEHGIATMNAVLAKNPVGGRLVATL